MIGGLFAAMPPLAGLWAGLGFAAPAVLTALAALPVLWLLLRATPPAPRRQPFPPLALLRGLATRHETAARTPWWLLVLRLLAAGLVIIGLAGPRLDPPTAGAAAGAAAGGGVPLLLVIDDGWTAAPAWEAKRAAALAHLERAALAGRPVQVLTTAPAADGGPPVLGRLGPAEAAREVVRVLAPKPWPADHAAALNALHEGLTGGVRRAGLWFTDGLDAGTAQTALAVALQRLGGLTVVPPPLGRDPLRLTAPERTADGLAVAVERPAGGPLPHLAVTVRALDEAGRVVAAVPLAFAAGEGTARGVLALPSGLRETLARLEAVPPSGAGDGGAAAVRLLDDRWRRPTVGVAGGVESVGAPATSGGAGVPLLAGSYYLDRALAPFAEVRHGPLDRLVEERLAVLVLPGGLIPAARRPAVDRWVRDGGVLIRFADPLLAEGAQGRAASDGAGSDGAGSGAGVRDTPDTLLPVRLLSGGRTLGGALSWAQPMGLAPFPADGPFAGLSVPADATVRAQVLAEPGPDLPARTWARLADGTPLVTGARHGLGWLVLVHTTANPDWSNLPLSGLFPRLLHRLADLAGSGRGAGGSEAAPTPALPLPLIEALDGFGRPVPPPPAARPLPAASEATREAGWTPGPYHPPGWYGMGPARRALSLAEAVTLPPAWSRLPPGIATAGLDAATATVDLRPPLLALALVLLLADTLIGFVLRGLVVSVRLNRRHVLGGAGGGKTGVGLLLVVVLAALPAPPARAADQPPPTALVDAALRPRLAHVLTGIPGEDEVAARGLAGLTQVLAQRTAAELAPPVAVDIDHDPLLVYPLLYWPAAPGQVLPGPEAAARVVAYLDGGGLILFDGRTPERAEALRTLLSAIDLPPLVRLPGDHVLTRAFYLLPGLPGRLDGGAVWIEQPGSRLDGVSGVVIGAADWAGAWAVDGQGRPLLPVLTGQRGREMAQRAGINLVMYALTGNYKGDQVHLPAILERLTQ